MEEQIETVLKVLKPDMFKIDYNSQDINDEGDCVKNGYVENTQWRHLEALYGIFDRLHTKYPEVILENCAAGGGRLDLGMVRRTHQSCQSDYTNQLRNIIALNNLTIAYPPEIFKYYYMMQSDYYQLDDFDFVLRVMMLSCPIILEFSRDFEDIDVCMERKLKYYIELYKNFIAPMLPNCKVYHHTSVLPMTSANEWCILEYVSEDRSKGYTMVFRLTTKSADAYIIRPK